MGIRGSPTAEIVFTDMIVPKENMLGSEGKGFNIAMQTLDGGRIGIAAQSLGIGEGAVKRPRPTPRAVSSSASPSASSRTPSSPSLTWSWAARPVVLLYACRHEEGCR